MTTDALCAQFSVYRGGKNTFSYCQCNNVRTYGVRCRAQDKVNIKPTENLSNVRLSFSVETARKRNRHKREIVIKEKSVWFVPSFNLQRKLFDNESCIPLSSGERSGSAARPLHSLIRPIWGHRLITPPQFHQQAFTAVGLHSFCCYLLQHSQQSGLNTFTTTCSHWGLECVILLQHIGQITVFFNINK